MSLGPYIVICVPLFIFIVIIVHYDCILSKALCMLLIIPLFTHFTACILYCYCYSNSLLYLMYILIIIIVHCYCSPFYVLYIVTVS